VAAAIVRFDIALMRLAGRENDAERRYAARLLDFVGNIGAVASLRLQQATRTLLDARLLAVFQPLRRSIVLNEWKWCTVDLLGVALAWALVAVYALSQRGGDPGATLWIGSLFMVHQYAQQAAGVLSSMAMNYQGLARTQADFAGADPIYAAPVQASPARAPRDAGGWRMLSLQQLTFAHATRERGGLHELSLDLLRGERIALVGPSGAGKSTLLRVLAGLYEAQSGQLLQDGVPRPRRDAAEFATLIPQEAEVFEASLRENLTLGQPTHDAALHDALHASAFDEVVAALPQGLATAMAERGANLSGGQRQRLALARGLLAARGSSLLLLDEPTSALDPLIERHVHERLEAAFPDATIVASVHRLALLPLFDRVVLMAGGRIVDVGTPDELRARQPLFAQLQMAPTLPVTGSTMPVT
jgi:ABC-type bacteriocin/lantibiotic exporter with double-glycine peptidase domain